MAGKKTVAAKKYTCPICNHGPLGYAGFYSHCKLKHKCLPGDCLDRQEGGGKSLKTGATAKKKTAKSTPRKTKVKKVRGKGKKKSPKLGKELIGSEILDGKLVLIVQVTIPFQFGLPELSEVL